MADLQGIQGYIQKVIEMLAEVTKYGQGKELMVNHEFMKLFKPCYTILDMEKYGKSEQEEELYYQSLRLLRNLSHLDFNESNDSQVLLNEFDCFNQIMVGVMKSYETQ